MASFRHVLGMLGVLAWADTRVFYNVVARLRQQPGRLIGWLFQIVSLLLLIAGRSMNIRYSHGGLGSQLLWHIGLSPQDALVAGLATYLVLAFLRGANAPRPFFGQAAEARFLGLSVLSLRAAILYVQIRSTLASLPRFLLSFSYIYILCAPPYRHSGNMFIALGTLVFFAFAVGLLPLPCALAPRWGQKLLRVIGFGMLGGIFLGILQSLALQGFVRPDVSSLVLHAPLIRLSRSFDLAFTGDVGLLCGILFLALCALAYVARSTRDAYPELYEISLAGWSFRRRFWQRMRGQQPVGEAVGVARVEPREYQKMLDGGLKRLPHGLFIYVWVEWQAFRRTHSVTGQFLQAFGCVLWGTLIGVLGIINRDTITTFIAATIGGSVLFGVVASVRVGTELRRPLFWLAEAKLVKRLAMVICATIWLPTINTLLFGWGAVIAGTNVTYIMACMLIACSGYWLQRAVGLVAFALFPRRIDQRGPATLFRTLLMYLFALPPVLCGMVGTFFLRLLSGCAIGAFVAVVEGILLLFFAAHRFSGRVELFSSE